jgi:nickel/cobalt exporter
MKIGNIEIANDTLEVLTFAGLATGAIVVFTGLGMLANNWNQQANPDREVYHYSHESFAAHGGHGDDHGGHGDDHGGEHEAPAADHGGGH